MKCGRSYFKAALALWLLIVMTASLLSGLITQSKYAAEATGQAEARIAKWDVADRWDESVLATAKDADEVILNDTDQPVALVFGSSPVTTTIALKNDSEVSARYKLEPYVDQGSAMPQLKIKGITGAEAYAAEGTGNDWSDVWVVVPYNSVALVALDIYPAAFTGLGMDVVVEQID